MKVKTSITLSPSVLADIDAALNGESRSQFIERTLRQELRRREREAVAVRDRAIYDRLARGGDPEHAEYREFMKTLPPLGDLFSDEDFVNAEG